MTRYLPRIARYVLGLIFVVFGSNAFLHFIPTPPPADKIVAFTTGLMSTGYFFPLLKITEITCGILLLVNRFVPLALVVLSPVIVQIAAFHFFFEHSGAAMAAVLVLLQAYLGWAYRAYFRPILSARAEPLPHTDSPASTRVTATAQG